MCGQSTEGLIIVMKENINTNGIDYVVIQDTEFRRWKGWGGGQRRSKCFDSSLVQRMKSRASNYEARVLVY